MNRRMTVATALGTGALALGLLAGCGTDEKPSPPLTQPTASATTPSAEPSASATAGSPATAADLVGDWADTEADWTVHFKDGGKFTMDYEGVTDFMSGTYTLEDGKVTLEGGDGVDEGTVKDDTLVFKLGTLERVAAE